MDHTEVVAAPTVAVPKHATLGEGFTHAERLKADEDPGRPATRVAGGWVSDLTEVQKFVMLCPFCLPKFNPRKARYELWRRDTYSIGKCDGCKQVSTHLQGFIHQSHHTITGEWEQRPRRGRWAR